MKKHENQSDNFYYVTIKAGEKWVGSVKPGTTQQDKVNKRINRIRFDEPNMQLVGFITIHNTNKARLEALEHEIKADLFDAGFAHFGNDHFSFRFNRKGSRKAQYGLVALAILCKAMKYCENHNLDYEITWCM